MPLLLALALAAACSSDSTGGASDAGDTGGDTVGDGGPNPSGNQPPNLARIGDKRAVVDHALVIELRATDPDGDPLDYSVFGDLPDGAKFDKETARFNWTPAADDLGSQWLVTFSVSDGEQSDRETITITVAASLDNSPPELIDPGDQQLVVNEPYELLLEATDPDGDVLSFSIVGTSPEGSTFDTAKGLFAWTPGPEDQDSNYRVLFQVSDGTETDDLHVNLRVGSATLRFPPIAPREVRLGASLSFTLEVVNPLGESYTCRALGTLPAGASFDTPACRFDWAPTDASLVNRTVQVPFEVTAGEVVLVQTASITVLAAGGGGECVADAFEALEAGGLAAPIEPGSYPGLTICGDDFDVFAITLEAGQEIEVSIAFEHDDLDIDLALWAPTGDDPFRLSEGVTDSETIRVENVPEGGSWQIEVYGIGTGDSTYDLTLSVSDSASCLDDGYEQNDTRATARLITVGDTIDAQWCLGDRDWFAFDARDGDDVTIQLASEDSLDLDLSLSAPSDTAPSWWGLEVGPTETLSVPGLPETGRYALQVFSVEEADSAYLLSVTIDRCEDDASDDGAGNDVPNAATSLEDGQTLAGRVFCDADWYFVILGPGDGAFLAVDYDVASFATPTVVFRRVDQPAETLGEIDADAFGVSVYLDAAPSEDIYVLGITAADRGMTYSVSYDFLAAQ